LEFGGFQEFNRAIRSLDEIDQHFLDDVPVAVQDLAGGAERDRLVTGQE
jgi:hypothetical protein